MMSVKKTKTPDHYPCGHMRGPGWHDWRACLTKQGIEEVKREHRTTVMVVGHDSKTLLVEAQTGNLAKALRKARV
ncbi:hypothetical protein PL914_01440 [Bifidobacterium adolescentis]|nr:hypothetical protein [Bifidobacterium adolescentis]MDB1419613.1 hypothetical protein [Bifidobacterium adolescentis]MDB1421619.1 hypothetical protein [Bifidobacterium adolescentis]MDB1426321.1 hypothetical protein [Bifidobacterium adolescentis]MDB1426736.1 hypothetical protein [Bifidobacterium adolescentis]